MQNFAPFLHNLDPVAVSIGPVVMRWYGIAYVIAILLCSYIIKRLDQSFGRGLIDKKIGDQLAIYSAIGIIVGGRLGYIIFYHPDWIFYDFFLIFKIWTGGMSFHGGLVGGAIAVLRVARANSIPTYYLSDIVSCAAPIGIFFGRIANFINGELFGKESDVPWAVVFTRVDNVPRHPSQLYEALFEGIILFLIMITLYVRVDALRFKGKMTGLFLILYSLARIACEAFRLPDAHIGYLFLGMSMGQVLSISTMVIGISIFLRGRTKI